MSKPKMVATPLPMPKGTPIIDNKIKEIIIIGAIMLSR
jgi:hypothetical protein